MLGRHGGRPSNMACTTGIPSVSGSARHGVTFLAQIFGQILFHLRSRFEGHRIQMGKQLGHRAIYFEVRDAGEIIELE